MDDDSFFDETVDGGPITIADVALGAGVSVSTVSRILNGKPDVAPSTRLHVQKVIQELGFTPQLSAQSLASRRSRTIALIFPLEHVSMTQLELDFFVGAAHAAEAQDYFLNLMTSPTPPATLVNLYRSRQADGTVLMQIRMNDTRVETLRAKKYPFVMIGRTKENDGLNFVDLDFESALTLAFAHLYDSGHRHIGFVARPSIMRERDIGAAVRSLNGYHEACLHYSCQAMVCEPSPEPDSIFADTYQLLVQHPHMSALIVAYGAASVPVLRAIHATGRQVPQNFSLVTITTNKVAALVTPPLTTINFPTDRMGYQATEILLRLLQDPDKEPEQILLAPELIVRETTASFQPADILQSVLSLPESQ